LSWLRLYPPMLAAVVPFFVGQWLYVRKKRVAAALALIALSTFALQFAAMSAQPPYGLGRVVFAVQNSVITSYYTAATFVKSMPLTDWMPVYDRFLEQLMIHARFKPLKYTNRTIKEVLGWAPKYSLVQAIEKSVGRSHGLETRATNGTTHGTGFQPVRATRENKAPPPLRVAYMTGEYPRATDTFIQREVAALRASGVHVETLSVRRPASN